MLCRGENAAHGMTTVRVLSVTKKVGQRFSIAASLDGANKRSIDLNERFVFRGRWKNEARA